MECTGKKILDIQLTEDEAENLKQEVLYMLRDYSNASKFTTLNTLNNLVSVELTRMANNN